jgi:YVTN family beta-propeller protein
MGNPGESILETGIKPTLSLFSLALICMAGAIVVSCASEPRVGAQSSKGIVVSTEQIIHPAGKSVKFFGRPVDIAISSNGKNLFVKDNRGIVLIDTASFTIRQQLSIPDGGVSMHGLCLTRDGTRLYVTGADNALWEAAIDSTGKAAWRRQIILSKLPTSKPSDRSRMDGFDEIRPPYPCGVALSPNEQTAYVCLSIRNTLDIVNLKTGKEIGDINVGVAPYDVVLSPGGDKAYVTNWAGRRANAKDHTAMSAGTPTVVDDRGIASTGSVSIVDLKKHKVTAEISVGLHPAGVALTHDGKRLYVANANSDTVSVIDTVVHRVVESISVKPDPSLLFGSLPNALALSPDESTLFVANGGNNALAVVKLADPTHSSQVVGFIPAGWFPAAVTVKDGRLFVANLKGIGSRDASMVKAGWSTQFYCGTVSSVDIPDVATLSQYTRQVTRDARVPESLAALRNADTGIAAVPVPQHVGEPSLFQHLVYIIKENRTYDQMFGDITTANGDPDLCIFDARVTPNHHAIARQFVLLDNFYCNGVVSMDGHQWAVEGETADSIEKTFGGLARGNPFVGDDPMAFVSSGFLWDDVLLHGLSFRNFGEMSTTAVVAPDPSFTTVYRDYLAKTRHIAFKQKMSIDELRRYSNPDSPGWNLAIPDQIRADVFIKELNSDEASGEMPNLTILYLPSDHTSGVIPGEPTPAAMVADNDLALGRVVDAISHSKFWPTTCIFVVEDDSQDGVDHVDGHRSLCLVASPYTRRHRVVSKFYNQTSVLHTMELMLGLPPMNQMDAMAPIMSDCFSQHADLSAYVAVPNVIPLDHMNLPMSALNNSARHWAMQSVAQRFDLPDLADEDTLNRVIWYSARGDQRYPSELAGAHGKGLRKLGLAIDPDSGDDD